MIRFTKHISNTGKKNKFFITQPLSALIFIKGPWMTLTSSMVQLFFLKVNLRRRTTHLQFSHQNIQFLLPKSLASHTLHMKISY